jgi:hypothetical protein
MQARSPLGILSPAPFERGRRRPAPELCARYVLEMPPGVCVAALEVQAIRRVFSTVSLLVSRCGAAGGWAGEAREALAFALSASLILGSADVAVLLPCAAAVDAELAALGWGNARRVWTPLREDAWLLALRRGGGQARGAQVSITDIDPAAWWLTQDGLEARKSLTYLEKRVALEGRQHRCKAPRQGFLSRFSQLLRWS